MPETPILIVFCVVLGVLVVATGVGMILRRQPEGRVNPALVQSFRLRIRFWWMLCVVLALTYFWGNTTIVVLFGLISFWALREYITVTPTVLSDHRTLFWVFFIFTPLQFVLVGMGIGYYDVYSVMIPVYGFLFILTTVAMAGNFKRYLERTAKIQAGLIVCVYCLSYAPAIVTLELPAESGDNAISGNLRLLFFFILITQTGDAAHFVCGKIWGRHVIAPSITSRRTWEGFFGSVSLATLIGGGLHWITPFTWYQATGLSLGIAVAGYAGGMVMSAIKRDRGVKEHGTLVEGHGGVLDRIDSTCFAAPFFFHATMWFQHHHWL